MRQSKQALTAVQLRHRFDGAMAGTSLYAGVDEVGRGCLAGPVVAAAVIPPRDVERWAPVDDSKRLSERKRDELAAMIVETAVAVGIGVADVKEVDKLNVLRATQLAMGRAVAHLAEHVEILLVDGIYAANSPVPSLPIVRGDHRSLVIGAASIVAKVHRDTYMKELHLLYPDYGFAANVGYGTKEHLEALDRLGPTEHHRMSFAPVRDARTIQTRLVLNG
ncbi:ribonuclease HII [Alicyclobacillus fastidiosus]|uniref:Ribonuclease HII n=1 Tax=Alicyclobacillus fastidiosus TaxID=392011 RepID=A0ABY6ZCT4_9BACL|nr:ribonuclease HII [Alicyclobacillus fastidiosus]WAH40353.1 ribonuclease HII [Alicyclobacillus fastidiosus]GMA61736.1 ribonuclease HII [Alicyclobacillus fastidiosus]